MLKTVRKVKFPRPLKETIINHVKQGLKDQQIANIYGCTIKTIQRWKRQLSIKNEEIKLESLPKQLTEEQNDLMIGCLLGDLNVRLGEYAKNSRCRFKQKIASLEYIQHLHEKMNPFSLKISTERNRGPIHINGKMYCDAEHWNGKWYKACLFNTISHPIFTELWEKWYNNRIKVIPNDLKLNWRILAYWAVDDGCNNQTRTNFTFHTNCFTVQEVFFLIDKLKKMGINSHITFKNKKPIIYIGKDSYFYFINGIKPYMFWECFAYKIDISKVKETHEGWGRKLNIEIAREIRELHKEQGLTQQKIADIYKVSQGTIGRIINNVTYREEYFGLKGEGTIKVSYNYND